EIWTMEFLNLSDTGAGALPPGVTSINDLKQTRVSRTLSKAVSLHLEGKLEAAARVLAKAIESGECESGLFSALGHIRYEMHDYDAACQAYEQLVALEPQHRTGHFNLGVCHGHLKRWKEAAEAFEQAITVDGTRSDAFLGMGVAMIHSGRSTDAIDPLEKYLT